MTNNELLYFDFVLFEENQTSINNLAWIEKLIF
jgi:hypothetical protein